MALSGFIASKLTTGLFAMVKDKCVKPHYVPATLGKPYTVALKMIKRQDKGHQKIVEALNVATDTVGIGGIGHWGY